LILELRGIAGADDLSFMKALSQPDPEGTKMIGDLLFRQRRQLEGEYSEVLAAARLAESTGRRAEAAEHRQRLQELNRRLGVSDGVLDGIDSYLTGDGRQKAYPLKVRLARELSETRIAVIRQYLVEAGIQNVDARLHSPPTGFSNDDSQSVGTVRVSVLKLLSR
jgi:hypothetical protein